MPGQWIVYAAAAGLAALVLFLAVFPFKDRPEPERIKPRPGSDAQFGEWADEEVRRAA